MEKAEIIVIGDELLIGQVVDTNSGMIARQLNPIGISVARTTAIHDDTTEIKNALTEAFYRSRLVLMTGGLGPTKDDITKSTLCEFFSTRLVPSIEVEQHVRALYNDRPDVLNQLTATQWLVPEKCNVLPNRVGSAPLMAFEQDGKFLYCMPGVPYEAQVAMEEQIIPLIKQKMRVGSIIHRTIIVQGIPESSLALRIADWENALPQNMHLAYLPKNKMIRLRLTGSTQGSQQQLEADLDEQISKLQSLVSPYLLATEDKPLELFVGEELQRRGQTISTAESCTGGRLAALLNKHSGSSAYFWGGIVAYDNSVKMNMLGVTQQTLVNHGAVSQETVIEMAAGARRLLHTDWAIATSGVAGPTGGTKEKPVGTVWIAIDSPKYTITECLHLKGNREQITEQAAVLALARLLKHFNSGI